MMHSTRGIWKLAMVVVGMVAPEPKKPHKTHRPYAKPLTPQDIKFIEQFHQIIERLKDAK